MKTGLLIAVESELKAFLESGSEIAEERISGRTIYRTRIGENEVFALCSGCGEIDAAAGTQLLITGCGCQRILNFGVTGALDPSLRVEDLFVVRKVLHYDFDTSPIDPVKPGQKGACEKNHVELRKVLPKGTDFDALTQWDVTVACSHVNSYVRAGQGVAPIALASLALPANLLESLGVTAVPPDDVVMRPGLLGL